MPSFLKDWFRITSSWLPKSLALVILLLAAGRALCQARNTPPAQSARLIAAVPMAFEENDGQLAPEFSYIGRAQSYSVAIERDRLKFFMSGAGANAIDVRFAGSRGGSPASLSGVAYRSNYLIGAEPSRWHQGVANFSRVGIRGIYPGIDTEFYDKDGVLEHDFIVAPGADAGLIRLDLRGAQRATLTANGDAVIPAHAGELRFRKPAAYQFDAEGRRVAIDASYRLTGSRLQFVLGNYDRSRTLVIDPVILFATYISGQQGSTPAQIASDSTGATVYVTGTTTSINGFPPITAGGTPGAGSSHVFVAALTTSQLGSQLKWLTFLGNSGVSTATSLAYSSQNVGSVNGGTIFVGGTTNAGSFPGASGTFEPSFPKSGSVTGFVAQLDGNGANPKSTYICSGCANAAGASGVTDTSNVTGLAADNSGNVFVAGYGLGVKLPVTANSLGGTSVLPTGAGTPNNAFVIELNQGLATAPLVTYLQNSATGVNYQATAIGVDSGNIYVAGTVGGAASVTFPTVKSFPGDGTFADNTFAPCSRATTNTSVFLAQIKPPSGSETADVLGFSMLSCADTTTGSESALGLAVASNALYLVGQTVSPDLINNLNFTNASTTTPAAATPTAGLQGTFQTGNINGYALRIPISAGAAGAPGVFTYLSGTAAGGDTTVYGVAIDGTNHLAQLVGQTKATRADMPGAGAAGLPAGSPQDTSVDNLRGFLYTFDDSANQLASAGLKSISYLGGANTGSKALSVAPDTTGKGAYVLVQDTNGATGSSFLSYDATGPATPNQTNTYVADIQGTSIAASTPGLTFTADASATIDPDGSDPVSCGGAGQPACVIGYDPSDSTNISTIEFKWTLSTTDDASNVVLNFSPVPALATPYPIFDGSTALSPCASAVTTTPSNGTTCTIPSLAAGSTHTISLKVKANTNDSPTPPATSLVGNTYTLNADATDAEGEYKPTQQPQVKVGNPVKLTLTFDQDQTLIDAASAITDTGATGHITEVTYTAKVTNSTTFDSPSSSLTITLPGTPEFYLIPGTLTATLNGTPVASGCKTDGTGCTGVDIPASGVLIYTFKALYLAANLSTTTPGPTSETLTGTTQASTVTPLSTSTKSVTTQVKGSAALAVTFQEPTGAPFNLNSGALVYKVTLTNNGPNAAGAFTLTNTLPHGFTVTSATCTATNAVIAAGTCDQTNGGGFNITSINSLGTVVYTINGSFPDKGTGDDAVPQDQPNATVKDSVTLTTPAGTYDPNPLTFTSTGVTVQRSVHIKLSLNTSGTTETGPGYTQPAYDLGTQISYAYTLTNTGPNIAVAVKLATGIAVNPPATYPNLPTNFVKVTLPTDGSTTCAPDYTSCTVVSVPASGSRTVTFTVTYPDNKPPDNVYPAPDVSAVPSNTNTEPYKTTITTPAVYTNAVDSDPAGTTTNGDNTTFTVVNIYRTVHLKITLDNSGTPGAVSGPGYTPTVPNAFKSYNLGTAVKYAYTVQNAGPNIALNVPLNNTLAVTNPAAYPAPPGSFVLTAPSGASTPCTPANNNTTSACHVEYFPVGTTTLNFTVAYPDLPPAAYVFPTQDLSAVPSNVTNATYQYSTITPLPYSNAIDKIPAGFSATDNASDTSVNIFRTSALTLHTPDVTGSTTKCAPTSSTPCFYMANSGGPGNAGLFDTATYTVQVNNTGPNLATNSVLTIPLPANFLVTPDTTVSFNGVTATGVASQLVCTAPPNAPATATSVICQGYIPSGTTGTPQVSSITFSSKFSTGTVPSGAAFTTTAAAPGSASVAAVAVGTYSPVNLPVVTIDRAAQLVAVKVVASMTGNTPPNAPNSFTVNGVAAVNLDEKFPGDAFGKNDTVQITAEVGNAGLNDATGVVVTDTLPPYFVVLKSILPSYCQVSGPTTPDAAGNPVTGAAPATLTCTLPNPVPRSTATAGSGSTHGTVNGAFATFTYYGKFADNGLQPDAVPLNQSSVSIQFDTLKATSNDEVDLGTGTDSTSAAVAPLPVMRAAHLHFTLTQYVQTNDAALNPVGGVSGPGIAEAQLGANGGEVINTVRYQVRVTNDGPNIAVNPVVTTTLPLNNGSPTTFTNVNHSIEPALQGFPTVPSGCTSAQSCQNAGMIATGAATLYNVDGNFDLNTLTPLDNKGDFGQRLFASAVSDASVIDSNAAASNGGDQQTSLPITVVNTPVGANFTLTPSSANLNLKIGTVQVAGITSTAASGQTLPPLPSGPSPNPPDNKATKSLYRFGTGGVYYTLATTAGVPTATQNPTRLCLTQIPDVFEKPERVLLWALTNAPAGTTFNTVPNYTGSGTAGDITVSVLPQSGGSYTVPQTITSYPPAVQAQPAQVCGVLNGLPDAANPTTLAVLEPVNYAPFIRTTIAPASSTSQPGKGVTASADTIDLTISSKNNYDYNDQDPCYTGADGTQRSTCDDNTQLTTFVFGGQNFIGDFRQQHSYFPGQLQTQPMPQFNLPAGQPQIYVLLTDQVGAQHYQNTGTAADPQGCDPGTVSATYTPAAPFCTDKPTIPAVLAVPPNQAPLTDNPAAQVALITGSVGFGGSTGLIAITETPEAIAHVTSGQTAGFVWNALTENPAVQGTGGNPPVFTLACVSADGTNLASVGITCNVPQTYVYSTSAGITPPPAVYVVTSSNTAVGALHEAPFSRNMQIVAAIVFPAGAIPLVLLLRRRKALRRSGWLAVIFFATLAGLSIGCGSSNFRNMGGTTTTATPAGTYELMVTATSGSTVINSPKFAVTVSPVH